MGEGKIPSQFRSCPVGTVFTDEMTSIFAAYNYHQMFSDWPPGRRSPKLVLAFMIIRDEERQIFDEQKDA